MKEKFKYGTCTVPCGKKGGWTISEFTVPENDLDIMMANMRAIRDGHAYTQIHPGDYKRLSHDEYGTVMSNTRMEVITSLDSYMAATGNVLVNGLGMGMFLEGILHKPDVKHVRVVEKDKDVIKLVAPYYQKLFPNRVEVVQGDAYEYKPHKLEEYDYIWHDIWNGLSTDNLPLMAQLGRKWAGRGPQGFWSREEMRRQKKLERESVW